MSVISMSKLQQNPADSHCLYLANPQEITVTNSIIYWLLWLLEGKKKNSNKVSLVNILFCSSLDILKQNFQTKSKCH